ncbi:hypothetical protein HPP92_002205 [Vanilla planifolia]|uniref:RRM domain-containing protein n=1 Tax=Vanilla planifolia TaxID=51239 RepID=A0A835VEA3_VANPL|nr:hypothetical protein HPP92_002205 [Vanilla planifolia]
MAKALAAARAGFRRFFSISAFTPPPPAVSQPKADPSPNLFVSGEIQSPLFRFIWQHLPFIGLGFGLSKRTTSEGLREAFSKFGEVVNAKVVTDRVSGYSKGFGFVRYASIDAAAEGIKGMDGKFLDGWVIFAEYARPREPPAQAQASVPQSTYGSSSQFNYSSPISQPTYNTSAAPSNYSSQASHSFLNSSNNPSEAMQPPSSNSYYATNATQFQSSQGSMPSSNYTSPTSQTTPSFGSAQPQSGYYNHSPQTSHGLSNYEPQHPQSGYNSQPTGNYFNNSPQTSQFTSNNGSVPLNYSSLSHSTQPSTWYPSQTTQPSSYMSGPPHYPTTNYGSELTPNHPSQSTRQTSNYSSNLPSNNHPQFSEPAGSYASAPNYPAQKSGNPLGYTSPARGETSEPSSSYPSELSSDNEPRRAANY